MLRVSLLLVTLLLVSQSHAENAGLAYYGIQHKDWPCNASLSAFKDSPEPRMSILWNTFGTNNGCLKKFLEDPRSKVLQVHLINEVCHRNNRCGPYEVLSGLSVKQYRDGLASNTLSVVSKVRDYFRSVRSSLDRLLTPQTRLYVSPGLESNLSCQAALNLMDIAHEFFGDRAELVWNPAGVNPFCDRRLGPYIFEQHGAKGSGQATCIQNTDGVHVGLHGFPPPVGQVMSQESVPQFYQRHKDCRAAFLWTAEMNGIAKGGFVDPRKRKNWPTKAMFQRLGKLIAPTALAQPVPPWSDKDNKSLKGCKAIKKPRDGAGGFLWKPESDTQAGSVVLLRKPRFNRVYLIKHGVKLGDLRFSGLGNPDGSGDRQHWRYPVPGHKLPYNVVLRADNVCYKLSNPKVRND